MKLCDRCRVSGCCLDYLSEACAKARRRECPDVRPNRVELISNMSLTEMSRELVPMFEELCEDGIPCESYVRQWPSESPED